MGSRLKPLNIWIISKGYQPDEGGLETYAERVAYAYAKFGHSVSVFTQTSAGPRVSHVGRLLLVDVGHGSQLHVMAGLLVAMWQRRADRPSVIHATTWRVSLPALLLGLSPIVVSVHGREVSNPSGLLRYLMNWSLGRAKAIVAVSSATRERLIGISPSLTSKTIVSWNGVSDWANEMPLRRGRLAGPLRILTACRLVSRKNIANAVKSVASCIEVGANIQYDIVGRGEEYDSIKALVRDLKIGNCVRLHGYVSAEKLKSLYEAADIFLHPQIEESFGRDFEGFGIAVADAMTSGVTCIAGRAGGPGEIIEHGVTGLLVDGNVITEISNAVMRLVHDEDELYRLGRSGQLFARGNFLWDAHAKSILGAAFSSESVFFEEKER